MYHPDLVVMDARLPGGLGIAACREIRLELPATRVVILTGYADPAALVGAAAAGASGYLVKQIRGRDLVAALETVGRGGSLLDPDSTEEALARIGPVAGGTDQDALAELTCPAGLPPSPWAARIVQTLPRFAAMRRVVAPSRTDRASALRFGK